MVGLVLGWSLKPSSPSWAQAQTDLSTTIALAGASGVALWAGLVWLMSGFPPSFAAYLPLWFTVQYLGHVMAFAAAPKKWSGHLGKGAKDAVNNSAPALAAE